MRKSIGLLVFLIVIGVGGYYILQKYFPNLVPPSKDIKQYLPLNIDTDTPIQIPKGDKMDVFYDLRGERPKVLAFDSRGTLFASITNVGKVVALPDFDKNFRPEKKVDIIKGLNRPHGIVFNGAYLYVAETNKVSRFRYDSGNMTVGIKEVLFSLPSGGKSYARAIKISGDKLYTSVGSSCEACIEKDSQRASILVSNLDGSDLKIFAGGLRNTIAFDFDSSGKMWGVDIGRGDIGDSLPPDELNLIEEGKNYGWPYCYSSGIRDSKMVTTAPVSCEHTDPPIYEFPAHSAPSGMVFDNLGNLIVSLNGSKSLKSSISDPKVVALSVFAESVANEKDYISGLVQGTNEVLARPSGLVYDKLGNLFIADDKTAMIYVLSK